MRYLSFMKAGTNVVLYGDEGTGQTHISQAIGLEGIIRKKAIFYRASRAKTASLSSSTSKTLLT